MIMRGMWQQVASDWINPGLSGMKACPVRTNVRGKYPEIQ